ALQLNSSDLLLDSVSVRNVDATAIQLVTSSPVFSNVSVDGAVGAAFSADIASDPSLSNLSATNAAINGWVLGGGTISANRNWDFGGIPLWVNGDITVGSGAGLTLVPGQVVKFSGAKSLTFNGTLDAEANSSNPIIFTSYRDDTFGGDTNADADASSPQRGDWHGLIFNDGSDASSLEWVEIHYAGNVSSPGNNSWVRPTITITDSDLSLNEVQILNVDSTGIDINSGSPTFSRITIDNARGNAVIQGLNSRPTYSEIIATNNGANRIWFESGNVSTDLLLDGGGLSYQMSGDTNVLEGVTLTVAPGQVVKFNHGGRLLIDGTLTATSTEELPIVFTSESDTTVGGDSNASSDSDTPVRGDWQGLIFNDTSDASVLQNVEVRYAGNASSPGNNSWLRYAIVLSNSSATLENVRVTESDYRGLRIDGVSNPELTNVTISNSDDYAVSSDFAANPVISNLAARGNTYNAWLFDGGTLAESRTWALTNIPYVFGGDVTVGAAATLTLMPGVVLKMTNGQHFQVDGSLSAVGTATQPIIFTSRRDDTVLGDTYNDPDNDPVRGDWQGLIVSSGSGTVELDYVDIRYAGNASSPGNNSWLRSALTLQDDATVRRTRIYESDYRGISIEGAISPVLDTVTIDGADNEAIRMTLNARPTLTGLDAIETGGDRLQISGGTIASDMLWDGAGLPIQLEGDVVLAENILLTIASGQTVKIPQGDHVIINGNLQAISTESNPIIF
ncbi:MAG: right-handed parallel beta-helix repeat-containing protein, partial [Verrucomicrobiae bacterium]|nr:right-handed parallel beta-helix repeat-containing protein [Verrucomicrobiae bacterium]